MEVEKRRIHCRKVANLEEGKAKYVCRIEEKEFTITVNDQEGVIAIEPLIILPTPEEFALIVEELRRLREKPIV